jgi:hypothetical protein
LDYLLALVSLFLYCRRLLLQQKKLL